jgi:hypothetical protein
LVIRQPQLSKAATQDEARKKEDRTRLGHVMRDALWRTRRRLRVMDRYCVVAVVGCRDTRGAEAIEYRRGTHLDEIHGHTAGVLVGLLHEALEVYIEKLEDQVQLLVRVHDIQ